MGFRKKNKAAIIPQDPPFTLGRYGSTEQLIQANDEAVARHSKAKNQGEWALFFMLTPVHAEFLGTKDQEELRRGALAAFHGGHPENIQTMMLYPQKFAIRKGRVDYDEWASSSEKVADVHANIISALIKESTDPVADIVLACEKLAPADKQLVLNNRLISAVKEETPDEHFIASLLKAGAQAHAFRSKALIYAIPHPHIAGLLHKNGANFNEALAVMERSDYAAADIRTLKELRKKYTGEPINEIDALRQQIQELRAEILKRDSSAASPAPQAPKPRLRPVLKKSRPNP